RMHKKLISLLQLQEREEDLDEFVLSNFEQMYNKFYQDLYLIPKENYVEIKYEEFVKNPIEILEKIYQDLSLPGFKNAKTMFDEYLEKVKNYKPSSYQISETDKNKIYSRWKKFINKWGYEKPKEQSVPLLIDSQKKM
ncbi:MAG: sulfotransferase, partial [Candidatus Heimdallarchaeaceae archaeon]